MITLRDEVNERFSNQSVAFNPLSSNPTKWSNTLKQFVGIRRQQPMDCLSVLDHLVGLAIKGLAINSQPFISPLALAILANVTLVKSEIFVCICMHLFCRQIYNKIVAKNINTFHLLLHTTVQYPFSVTAIKFISCNW